MTEYKIVATDLDGTLFRNDATISKENLAAIHALTEQGVLVVPSTGRTFCDITRVLTENDDLRYFICSTGALVYDKKTGTRIVRGLNNSLLRRALDALRPFDVHVSVRVNGATHADAALFDDTAVAYYHICDAHVNVLSQYGVPKENFSSWSYAQDNVESLALFFHTREDWLAAEAALGAIEGLHTIRAFEYNLEVFHETAGKGDALHALADLVGVDRTATIAIGDSNNDLSILQAAGLGLAVSNACEALQDAADAVICSNEEHALAHVAEHYFKKNK